MCAMKTPGVYIVEKNAFPSSVVEVATAVPAFIGYTEKAKNGTKSLLNVPWKISSLTEYEQYFGGAPEPEYKLDMSGSTILSSVNGKHIQTSLDFVKGEINKAQGLLAKAETASKDVKDETDVEKAEREKTASATLEKAKPLVALLPDIINDFVTILKTVEFDEAKRTTISDSVKPIEDITSKGATELNTAVAAINTSLDIITNTEINNIKPKEYGISVARTDKYNLYYNLRFFFANGGGPCYIVSVGDYQSGDISKDLLVNGISFLLKEQEPTIVLVPEAVKLKEQECYDVQVVVLQHCGKEMRNRVALFDIYNGYKDRKDESGDVITKFREAIGTEFLDFGAAYYPWLNTSIISDNEINFKNIQQSKDDLILLLKAHSLHLKPYIDDIEKVLSTINKTNDAALLAPNNVQTLHKVLSKQSPIYAAIIKEIVQDLNLLPPASAMAGIYTLVDSTKEVWNAPANIGISNVVSPTVNISHVNQEDLNVPLNGKAVNAIRYFVGDGVKVWGARTLDGNSLDWRYINVRRTMIMLEESIKNATKAFVFEPNTANTWVSVRSMISNFLNGIWKRGGLAGSSPEDAFSVHIGLGDTMTPEDILEGIMRITVLVAIVRPAEFIEITFQQQMQKS